MKRPVFKRFGERPRFPAAFWLLVSCFLASLFFLLFQGGKVASMLLIMMTFLSVYLLSGNWSGIKRVQGTRKLISGGVEGKLEAGQSLQIRLNFQIPGYWPIPYVMIKDQLIRQNGDEAVYEGSIVPDWKRKGEFNYLTPPLRRGYYRFETTECLTEDIFGFFQHRGRVDLEQSLTVYPQTVAIREWAQFHQMLKGMQHHSTATSAHRETTQINGVREYMYGDRLSRIHWNATAKTGTWKSKEFERESLPRTIILLDRTARAYRDEVEFELAVSVAASLFRYGTGREMSLGLLSAGKELTYFEPKHSQQHYKDIVKHLVGVDADGFQSLSQLMKERSQEWPVGSLIIVVSPQKGSTMLYMFQQMALRQMKPCHIWIHSQANQAFQAQGAEQLSSKEDYIKAIRSQGYLGYEVSELADLPNRLGGAKRYA